MRHVVIQIQKESPMIEFAAEKIRTELKKQGCFVHIVGLNISRCSFDNKCDHIIIAIKGEILKSSLNEKLKGWQARANFTAGESYLIWLKSTLDNKQIYVVVTGSDERGVMYGGLDVAEQLSFGNKFAAIKEKFSSPWLKVRAIKFNLPFKETVYLSQQDVEQNQWFFTENYWERFLDMMVENRFNTLTLWSSHPFPLMIKLNKYPEAGYLNQQDIEANIQFFQKLFQMAKNRGIDTYIFTWNIHLPEYFAKRHGILPSGDDSPLVRDYIKECVKTVLQTYPDLTGIGTCPGEAMGEKNSEETEKWIRDTYIAGIIESGRTPLPPFWHRYHGTEPEPLERVIASEYRGPTLVTIKYNSEHMLSHPDSHFVNEKWFTQEPKHYQIIRHLRNDSVFILRWGDPHFVKKLLANCRSNSVGYMVGSEIDIPGPDLIHSANAEAHQGWEYKFEKQWFFWMLMGRLGYENDLSESLWKNHFYKHFRTSIGEILYQAMLQASKVAPLITCMHWGGANGSWYPEGNLGRWGTCWGKDRRYELDGQGKPGFHSVIDYMFHHTISNDWQNIPEYVNTQLKNRTIPKDVITPVDVAKRLKEIGKKILRVLQNWKKKPGINREAQCMYRDLEAWANLSLYYSNKVLAAIELLFFITTSKEVRRQNSLKYLQLALKFWKKLSLVTSSHYKPYELYIHGQFSWTKCIEEVVHDLYITENIQPDPEGLQRAGLIGDSASLLVLPKFDLRQAVTNLRQAVTNLKLGL